MRKIFCPALLALFILVVATASAAAAPFEPNDNVLQAFGPLEGDKNYDTTKETSNDSDWFYFYTAGQAQLSFSLTYVGGGSCDGNTVLYEADATTRIDYQHVSPSEPFDEYLFTAPGAKKYYIHAHYNESDYNVGCVIRLRVSPAALLTSVPPPSTLQIQTCQTGQSNAAKFTRAKASAVRKRKKSRRRSTKRKLSAKIKNYNKLIANARAQVEANCTAQVLELLNNDPAYK